MFIPGQVNNINMIIDIGKLGVMSFPSKIIKACMGEIRNNFRGISFRSFMLNTTGAIGMIWKLMEPMIPKIAREKMTLSQPIESPDLIGMCHPS